MFRIEKVAFLLQNFRSDFISQKNSILDISAIFLIEISGTGVTQVFWKEIPDLRLAVTPSNFIRDDGLLLMINKPTSAGIYKKINNHINKTIFLIQARTAQVAFHLERK